ncbi:phosphatase PAP2 family protein [Secundilactobacillus silagei]|nr:phosphatase PAP2 family protein [Secundilactobacillus silagei]
MRQQANRVWWLIASLAWIGFLILAVSVWIQAPWVSHFDQTLQQIAITVRQPSRTIFFAKLAFWGTATFNLLICGVIALWLWLTHHHLAAGFVLTAQVGINMLTTIFKLLIQRARPAGKLVAQGGYSFPSGHTTATAMLVLILLLVVIPLCHHLSWRLLLSVLSLAWLVMIGFDRIYLFVHYPSDVLAGLCLALGWWSILQLTIGKTVAKQPEYL